MLVLDLFIHFLLENLSLLLKLFFLQSLDFNGSLVFHVYYLGTASNVRVAKGLFVNFCAHISSSYLIKLQNSHLLIKDLTPCLTPSPSPNILFLIFLKHVVLVKIFVVRLLESFLYHIGYFFFLCSTLFFRCTFSYKSSSKPTIVASFCGLLSFFGYIA